MDTLDALGSGVSHESGTAVLSVNDKFLVEQIEAAVRDAGYEFIGIQ